MSVLSWIKERMNKMLGVNLKKVFDVEPELSDRMEQAIDMYYNITAGSPPWEDEDDEIESINFAQQINTDVANLVALGVKIEVSGSKRAEYIQEKANYILAALQDKVCEAVGNIGMMFKANGENVDYIEPGRFIPTETNSNGDILGCVFISKSDRGEWHYTRYEWHRFETRSDEAGDPMKVYRITNYTYKSSGKDSLGDPCPMTEVPEWAGLETETALLGVDTPLYSYFRIPGANFIDRTSPLGLPIWASAIKELKALDIAWSRNIGEIELSKHSLIVPQAAKQYADQNDITLPKYITAIESVGVDDMFHEHVATLLTEDRINGINAILAMISTRCGFSQGFYQLNEKTGVITATQVEANDQATIRTIKNIRTNLQNALESILKAIDTMATLYELAPAGEWEATYHFDDITYNFEEDRAHYYTLATQGKFPWKRYYAKFLGYSEEDAEKLLKEAADGFAPSFDFAEEE